MILLSAVIAILIGIDLRLKREVSRYQSAETSARETAKRKQEEETKRLEENKHLFDRPKPEVAQSFSARSLWGKTITFGSTPWKATAPMVLHLWGPWCGPCRDEFPAMLAFSRRHPDLQIAAISVNSEEKYVDKFLGQIQYQKKRGRVSVFIGSEDNIIFADNYYKVSVFPTTIYIDRDGKIVRWTEAAESWNSPDFERFVEQFEK